MPHNKKIDNTAAMTEAFFGAKSAAAPAAAVDDWDDDHFSESEKAGGKPLFTDAVTGETDEPALPDSPSGSAARNIRRPVGMAASRVVYWTKAFDELRLPDLDELTDVSVARLRQAQVYISRIINLGGDVSADGAWKFRHEQIEDEITSRKQHKREKRVDAEAGAVAARHERAVRDLELAETEKQVFELKTQSKRIELEKRIEVLRRLVTATAGEGVNA